MDLGYLFKNNTNGVSVRDHSHKNRDLVRGTQRFVSGNIFSEGLKRLRYSDLIPMKLEIYLA